MKKTRTVIGLLHPEDGYHARSAEIRGREVTSHTLNAWRDGWLHGGVTFANGDTAYFHKIRLLEETIK